MTAREKDAVLIVSTLVVLSIGSLFLQFDYINQTMWSALTLEMIARYSVLGILIVGVTYALAIRLREQSKLMRFSWLKLVRPFRDYAENIAVMPLYLFVPLAVAYTVVLIYVLPTIAFNEEWLSRRHISDIGSAVVVTVVFALVHILVGATIGGTIALLIPSGFLALVYTLEGYGDQGLIAATYLHVFYDVGAVLLVTWLFVQEKRKDAKQQTPSS